MRTLLATVAALSCVTLAASAEIVVLTSSADTTLFQNFPDNNLGGVTNVASGTTAHNFLSRALFKFDLAGQIPQNAIITSARLRLKVVRAPLGPQASAFSLHRVLRSWAEGNKADGTLGNLATAGETTWNNRFHPSTPWQAPGGAAGVDFSTTVSSSSLVSDLATNLFDTSPEMVADVQHWVANPSQNFGWMLISTREEISSTARRFGSHEVPADAPAVEIEYAPPFRIDNVALANATIRFSFTVEPLFTYTVESRPSLSAGTWNILTNFTETTSSYEATISDSATASSRFYRVLKAPCNCQ